MLVRFFPLTPFNFRPLSRNHRQRKPRFTDKPRSSTSEERMSCCTSGARSPKRHNMRRTRSEKSTQGHVIGELCNRGEDGHGNTTSPKDKRCKHTDDLAILVRKPPKSITCVRDACDSCARARGP